MGYRPGRRFIPAWAGNTSTPTATRPPPTVHPRVGGEHASRTRRSGSVTGSSPRGRGTPHDVFGKGVVGRFIPAWAGNTCWSASPRWPIRVHPRVGGEHACAYSNMAWSNGSSPRGRGTHDEHPLAAVRRRFIPAWAGNTGEDPVYWNTASVHPRVGGEHYSARNPSPALAGSSPRGRGTLQRKEPVAGVGRFIPAWAGNTPAAASTWCR